jgi:hypothetical protein
MPRKKMTPGCEPGSDHYVSVDGDSTKRGTIDSPWSLDYAARGAGGCIQPGHTVWVRGGTYRSNQDFEITVSGTDTDKITFQSYQGETVILDGALPEFTTTGNDAWVADVPLSPDHNVYHSARTYPLKNVYYGGFIQIDCDWYSLAPHTELSYLLSDNQKWEFPQANPRYLGPGISLKASPENPDMGTIYIRLDHATPEAQLGRPVAQVDEPDPRQHKIYLCRSNRFGLRIKGSHLVIEGFTQINNFIGCFVMDGTDQTDITIRNCGGRPIRFGARCGTVDGLLFDSCNFYAHMPSDRWWIAYEDIKGAEFPDHLPHQGEPPAKQVRKAGLDLGLAAHVVVVNCLLDEFFDGILAQGSKATDLRTAHDIEVANTTFNHIWDDAWQMNGSLYTIDFHHNFCYGAGPSIDNPWTNDQADTIYIHHNLIDTTTRLVFRGRFGSPGAGIDESSPLPSHMSSNEYAWPRKLYYNTIVTGRTCSGPDVGWSLPKAHNPQGTHEVYNNIFVVLDGRPGGRDFDATSGREIYDGNVYWCYFTNVKHVLSPWRELQTSANPLPLHLPFSTVAELQASQAFLDSQRYYPPGWEYSGLSEDPQLDNDYKPQNPSCQTGAVNLTGKPLKGVIPYEWWRGAIKP